MQWLGGTVPAGCDECPGPSAGAFFVMIAKYNPRTLPRTGIIIQSKRGL